MGPPTLGLAPGDGGLKQLMDFIRPTTALILLGSCLAFAGFALDKLAEFPDASAILLVSFALAAILLVLTALVIMYWRDPAFLTLSGHQAHDIRRLEILIRGMGAQTRPIYIDDLASVPSDSVSRSELANERRGAIKPEELSREQENFSGESQ